MMARKLHGNEFFETLIDTIERIGYIERNGKRYSLVALSALLRVVSGNPEQLTSRTRCIYRYRHRKA